MINNLKLKALTLGLAFALPVCSAEVQPLDKISVFNDAYSGYQLLRKDKSHQKQIIDEYSTDRKIKLLDSLQSLVLLKSEHSHEQIEDAIFYIMLTEHPELKDKWDDSVTFSGFKVFQDDHMINFEQYSLDLENPMINKVRIKSGLAPVGYDGLPIEICSLTKDSNSSKFEILSTQTEAFINLSRLGLSKEEACLSESESTEYWKQRHDTLVDQHLNYTPRYRYE